MNEAYLILLAFALCVLGVIPAAGAQQVDAEGDEVAGTYFTLREEHPTFTVTIPDSIELSKDGTDVYRGQ